MHPDLIDTFLDLCETKSFNQTAERLGVTQSTVSGRIRTLEAQIERPLFTRSRAGTALTTEGLRFEPHARILRHSWSEALRATRDTGARAMTIRISIQLDLAQNNHIGDWVSAFRTALSDCAFYIESDYSGQMCRDLVAGRLDLAVLFTPMPGPDLHFETLGEIAYRMISTEATHISEIHPDRYILANYSPAFARTHSDLLPRLAQAPIISGQNADVESLLRAMGGSAYVLHETAIRLTQENGFRPVSGAPPISQAVYAGIHNRHRHRAMHRRLIRLLHQNFIGAR